MNPTKALTENQTDTSGMQKEGKAMQEFRREAADVWKTKLSWASSERISDTRLG